VLRGCGMSREDAQDRKKIEKEIKGANWLTQVHLEMAAIQHTCVFSAYFLN